MERSMVNIFINGTDQFYCSEQNGLHTFL